MGGPAGVDRAEINRLTLQPENGLWFTISPQVLPQVLMSEP